jgi:hypothetical protein
LYFEYHYIINLLPTNLYNHILFHLFINIYYYYYCYYVKLLIFTRFFKCCRRVVSSAGNDEIKVDIRGGERLDARMLGSSAKRHHNNHHLHNVSQRRLADLWIDDSHVPLLHLGRPGAEAIQAVNRISAWARWASRASPRCFGGHFDSLAGRRVGGHGRIAQTLTNRHFGLQRRRSERQKWRLESLVDAHQLGAEFDDEFGQRKW